MNPLWSLAAHPLVEALSSYEDGRMGGDSPRLMRLFGELEKDGMALAHSLVACAADNGAVGTDVAPNSGDTAEFIFPFPGNAVGCISGD